MEFVGGKRRDYAPWKCSKIGGVKQNQSNVRAWIPVSTHKFLHKDMVKLKSVNYKRNPENMHLNKNNIYVQEI